MKVYHINQIQFLPVKLEQAWDFFCDPRNLEDITPAAMQFRILNISRPGRIYEGQIIHYKIRILPFVWVNWLTEITKVNAGEYFIDDQRIGPYRLWHHQHHFKEVEGGVEMCDSVAYAIPYGWLGRLAHWLFVGKQLKAIFQYRRSVLERQFGNDVRRTIAA